MYAGWFVPNGVDPFGMKVQICIRQFLPGSLPVQSYATYFDKGYKAGKEDTGPIGHVFLLFDGDTDAAQSYSFHPATWPNEIPLSDANQLRIGRI